MDYVVGSVAALISGNVTPSRPKAVRRALTPIKHQASPNVTPKSEFVDDRSIFLSPTLQKKKAIVKKSPKRIFQNPDLDVTSENENNSNPSSPKADKVKKHLNEELEANSSGNKSTKSPKKKRKSSESSPPRINPDLESPQSTNESTPKKQKKRKFSEEISQPSEEVVPPSTEKAKKKNNSTSKSENTLPEVIEKKNEETPKKKKKNSKIPHKAVETPELKTPAGTAEVVKSPKKKNKKRKNKAKGKSQVQATNEDESKDEAESKPVTTTVTSKKSKKKGNNLNFVNPNAITDKDSDSEHDSDDEIVSENEEANKEVLDTGPVDESSDEDEEASKPKKTENKEKEPEGRSEEEVKRTLFVGNVPFSKKCKKEVKKIFSKYGDIETVRIRTVPVKDARVTAKLAVIKNELHPERSTVNVYIKFKDASSVEQALCENNTVLNDCHLRVSRSELTGAEHDPRLSVFVGNVPFALEDEALRERFEKCGEITSVRIVRDRKTNAGKGFGYVNFASKDGVELALALSEEDLTIKNRILRVKRSTQTNNKQKNQNSGPGKSVQGKKFQGKNFQDRNQGGRNVQNSGQFRGKGGNFRQRPGQTEEGLEGASRRIMHKRRNQESGDGPPDKRQKNINQPHKEKKTRQEFVGMTAEKKKKQTFTKGQKKKKALSEILTKYS